MKTMLSLTKTAFLCAATLAIGSLNALAAGKVTVGVGHMCCAGCVTSAKASLEKVSSAVAIDGKNITITMKDGETNLVPVLDALRKGGFPATHVDAGSAPVAFGMAHLCCGGCNDALTKALKGANIEALDTDSMKIDNGVVTLKPKGGKTLDLAPIMLAMEKGGFSAKSITLGAPVASIKRPVKVSAR